ncbi:sulfite oxidase [Cryptosporangium aurantiacum]|uniref:DMSO/TMAO reductase YedYZ, molybdopterin-dependent catalytic subunit n=1 Tax=Cryptosporangium aurantiacum TaxID=134849 RepID=A0A1M7RPN4_9ACTN|nr:sulfite oxidase [Cryptosporangium aurantiacum]SHN48255.1 DMSO/TMAO reductase YedYZ, molybdopterin-dependent catalytic subunit [Cryptosporangium aurantiacum]
MAPMTRRGVLRATGGAALALPAVALAAGSPASAQPVASPTASPSPTPSPTAVSPIRKPLPPEWFTVFGTNAETRFDALAGTGYYTPNERFFVRNHTATPTVEVRDWRLRLFGSGLRGAPTLESAVTFTYQQLLDLPAVTVSTAIECAGNGRSFFTTQQGQTVSGTAWKLGAVGVARWRGVRLSTVLERAGLSRAAVDLLPRGLDADFVTGGVNLGRVRRVLPIGKALDDVILAYGMNGEQLPPDHGFPVRLVVPSWIGIASIKWLGDIEVSATPLASPWDTQYYRLFGPDYPAEGSAPLTRQVTKSAFELGWGAQLAAGRTHRLTGRSWSGRGAVRKVEVSVDGGSSWRRAALRDQCGPGRWVRWDLPWRPEQAGAVQLLARATDSTGTTQPAATPLNTLGYLFDAVVRHPVTVA